MSISVPGYELFNMTDSKEPWLTPDTILDADIVRQLFEYYGHETLTLKQFTKGIRKQKDTDLQQSLQPFLKHLPAISSSDGTEVTRSQNKAAGFFLRSCDVKPLHKRFGGDFESREAFRHFLEYGDADTVAQAITSAVQSKKFSRLPDKLQYILKNRADLPGRSSGVSVELSGEVPPAERVPSGPKIAAADPKPILWCTKHMDESQLSKVIAVYAEALGRGLTKLAAKEAARVAADKIRHDARGATESQQKETSMEVSVDAAPKAPLQNAALTPNVASLESTTERKRKHRRRHDSSSEAQTPLVEVTKKQRRYILPVDLGMGGQTKAPYISFSSPSSTNPKHGMSEDDQPAVAGPGHDETTRKRKTSDKVKYLPTAMTEVEEQLLAESLTKTNRKLVRPARAVTPQAAEKSVATTAKANLAVHSKSGQSTPRSASERDLEIDNLLQDCFKVRPQDVNRSGVESATAKPLHAELPQAGFEPPNKSTTKQKKRKRTSVVVADRSDLKLESAKSTSSTDTGSVTDSEHGIASSKKEKEAAFLLECLRRTKGTPRSKNTSPLNSPEPHTDHGTAKRRITSPELTFSPASGDVKKRKYRSAIQAVDSQASDVLEVDESDYDEGGTRIDKLPTIRSTKKRKPVKDIGNPAQKSTSSEDAQSHSSAQSEIQASVAKASSGKVVKRPFHSPMNCETM